MAQVVKAESLPLGITLAHRLERAEWRARAAGCGGEREGRRTGQHISGVGVEVRITPREDAQRVLVDAAKQHVHLPVGLVDGKRDVSLRDILAEARDALHNLVEGAVPDLIFARVADVEALLQPRDRLHLRAHVHLGHRPRVAPAAARDVRLGGRHRLDRAHHPPGSLGPDHAARALPPARLRLVDPLFRLGSPPAELRLGLIGAVADDARLAVLVQGLR